MIGRTPKILQGEGTERTQLNALMEAVAEREVIKMWDASSIHVAQGLIYPHAAVPAALPHSVPPDRFFAFEIVVAADGISMFLDLFLVLFFWVWCLCFVMGAGSPFDMLVALT